MMTHTTDDIRHMRAASVNKLLREHGLTQGDIAKRRGKHRSLVSRVIRKQAVSEAVLEDIVALLNGKRKTK